MTDFTQPKTAEEITAMIESLKSKSPTPLESGKLDESKNEELKAKVRELTKPKQELTRPRPTSAMFSEIIRLHGSEVNRILNRYGVPPGDMDKCLTELSQLFD